MAKGDVVAAIEVTDPERYEDYIAANAGPIAAFGGRFLVRGGRSEVVEGTARRRTVVVEFDSYDTALAFYRSPDYQAAVAIRKEAAESDLVVVEGFDGPQPGNA